MSLIDTNPATCFGLSNGGAIVGTAGCNYPYTNYNWSPSTIETDSSVNTLAAGIHKVIVTDSKGCKDTLNGIVIKEKDTLSLSFNFSNALCFGSATGKSKVTAAGGNGAYTYLWTNGSTADSAVGLISGIHSVTVKDAQLCQKVGSIIITEPTLLISSKQSDSVKCFGGSTGSAKIIPSGGTPSYTYLWSTGATIDSITSRTANAYYVTTTDSKGCQK
ncbi:MAG: SprB repeat-containing protein [Bacteroidetes bacterium]|nr:SprB repeat-containing protein [Bacteroidota bacterium]